VYFPPGAYRVDTRLRCKSNVSLKGVGSASVITAGATNTNGVVFGNGKSNIAIEDLVLDGNKAQRPDTSAGPVSFQGIDDNTPASNIRIRRCEIRNSPNMGCYLRNIQNSDIVDCWIHDCGATPDQGDGISVFGNSEDINLAGNLIETTTDDSIGLNAESATSAGPHTLRRIAIADNVIIGDSGANDCIGIHGAQQVTVDGNVIWRGEAAGVGVTNFHNTPGRDIVISNNVLVESAQSVNGHAIIVNGAAAAVFDDFGAAGCDRVLIKDNVILNPRHSAIVILAASNSFGQPPVTDISIEGNTIFFDQASGATIESSARGISSIAQAPIRNLRIANNVVRSPKSQGIEVNGSSHSNVEIAGNRVFDCGASGGPSAPGIEVTSPAGIAVKNNLATDTRAAQNDKTQTYGLVLTNPTGDVEICGNNFNDNKVGLVNFSGPALTRRLRVRDNPGYSPWTNEKTLNGGWGGLVEPFTQEAPVSFGLSFPNGKKPKVLLTVQDIEAYAVAKSVTESGFVLRVVSRSSPSSVTVAWLAEPQDT
jgi:hypothetical protein